jgi:hypothetical protein
MRHGVVTGARLAVVAAVLACAASLRAADKDPAAPRPVPVPYPNVSATATSATTATTAARDAASGLPTGKRMHKPWMSSASARKIALADGSVFVVNADTGEVVFGDGLHGARPEAGTVPKNGSYRIGGGAAGNIDVRNGKVIPAPTPVPTRLSRTK